jgi:hypothetical protein
MLEIDWFFSARALQSKATKLNAAIDNVQDMTHPNFGIDTLRMKDTMFVLSISISI